MNQLSYYSNVRLDILPLIEKKPYQRVLEVGCGTAKTLAYLKQNGYASYVVGVEKVQDCCDIADPLLDRIISGDVETLAWDKDEKFDVILLLDVIEHLYEPFLLLKRMEELVNPGGYMIISIPNIRNIAVLKRLIINDEWEYQDYGILDRTHIRFFTKKSFVEPLHKQLQNVKLLEYHCNYDSYKPSINWMKIIPFLKDFFVCQHIFKIQIYR